MAGSKSPLVSVLPNGVVLGLAVAACLMSKCPHIQARTRVFRQWPGCWGIGKKMPRSARCSTLKIAVAPDVPLVLRMPLGVYFGMLLECSFVLGLLR